MRRKELVSLPDCPKAIAEYNRFKKPMRYGINANVENIVKSGLPATLKEDAYAASLYGSGGMQTGS
jgi:hypothetical protein